MAPAADVEQEDRTEHERQNTDMRAAEGEPGHARPEADPVRGGGHGRGALPSLPLIFEPARWARRFAEARNVRWGGRSGRLPTGLLREVVDELGPHVMVTDDAHLLANDPQAVSYTHLTLPTIA